MRRVGLHGAGFLPISALGTPAPGGGLPCWYLDFDGIADRLTLAALAIATGSTCVAWVKRDNGASGDCLFGQAAGYYWNLDGATMRWRDPALSNSTASCNTTNWMHLAVVTRLGLSTLLYRDGVDISSATPNGVGITIDEIGRVVHASNYFGGYMAAIGIAPSVLNIPALWAAGTLHRPLDPLVFTTACWNMRQEGGAGVTLIDEAIGRHDCTFLGAGQPAWSGLMAVGGPAGWSDT